jgi:energy-coupling factor transporter ATP-binding protein EcfA2
MDYERIPDARSEIVIKDLVKHYGDVKAVNGLNLEIRKGEMFGFLGPNGAGKTTTISMLCGLLEPTAGSAQIAGFDIGKEPQKVLDRPAGGSPRGLCTPWGPGWSVAGLPIPGANGSYSGRFGAAHRNRREKLRRGQWTGGDLYRAHDDVRRVPGGIQRYDPYHRPVHAQLLRHRFVVSDLSGGRRL